MTEMQRIWAEENVWVGERSSTMAYRAGSAHGQVPPGCLLPVIAPPAAGGPVLWLDARGMLSGPGPAVPLAGLSAIAADPWLLVAAGHDGMLRLQSERLCTSLALPDVPALIAPLGAPRGGPALALVDLPAGVHALSWQDDGISVQRLTEQRAQELLLLAGDPPIAVVRLQGGMADRLLLFWHRRSPWSGWLPLPPLLLRAAVPTRLRQTDAGPCVRVGDGAWLCLKGDAWGQVSLPESAGVATLRYGTYGSWDLEPWLEKEQIPPSGKLAVGRRGQGNQEPIAQEKVSQRVRGFVRGPDAG